MSQSSADLGALAVARASPELRHPRRWWTRVFLPGLLIAGFAGLAIWASWDLLAPPVAVKIVPVRVQTGSVEIIGQELFKANGWIEPYPRPIDVPVQTEGMYRVEDVLVNPGDRVAAGKQLVKLDDSRAVLDRDAAGKRHARRLAAAKAARADEKKAEVTAANAVVVVQLAKSEGAAEVSAAEAELARAEAGVRAAELTASIEEQLWNGKAVTSDVKLRLARQALEVAKSDRDAAAARLSRTKTGAEVRSRQAELALALAVADRASLEAKAEEADQEVADAAIEVRKAELELERAIVAAPVDGIVMALNVRPGSVVGGKDSLPEFRGALATLYDPKRLQVRVEVPVAKFASVRQRGPAEVEVEDVLPGKKLAGVVLYDSHQANVSRNSVPVRVELVGEPPPQLRPEMIASVRFVAPPSAGEPKKDTARRIVIPRRLLVTDGDSIRVWVAEIVTGRAELRSIELARGEKDRQTESVEVVGGLNPTDKLIATGREQLKPGTRILVIGEDR